MAVDINIPGIGVVSANNAAQDSTLNAILSAIQAQTGTTTNVSAAGLSKANQQGNKLAGTLGILGGATSNTGDQIADAGKAASNAAGRFTAASTKVFDSFGMLASQSTTTGGMMGGIGKGITSLGATISNAASHLPGIVGKLSGGLTTVASGTLGLLTGVLSKNIEQYEKIQAAGGSFGYSLEKMRQISHEAGISVEMMSNIVQKAGHQLSMFGGTTEDGALQFAKQNKRMQDTHGDSLLRMGIGYQEQGQYLAEFMGDLVASGANLSELDPTQLNNSFMTLTKQQKMFAQYNGTTLEQERQKAKANKEDAQLQAALLGLAPEQRKAAEIAIGQAEAMFGPQAGKAMKEMFLNGGEVFTAGSAALMGELGTGVEGSMKEIVTGIKDKSITNEKEMVTAFDNMGKSFGPEQLKNMAELVKAGAMGATGPAVDALTGAYIAAERTLNKAVNETFPKIQKDTRQLDEKASDPLTQNAIIAAGVVKEFQTTVDKTVDKMLGSSVFTTTLNTASDVLRGVTGFVKDVTANPSAPAAPPTSGSWTDDLQKSIVNAIRDGFNFVFSGADPVDSSARTGPQNNLPDAPSPELQGGTGDTTLPGGAGNDTLNNNSEISDDVAEAIKQTPVLLQQVIETIRRSSEDNARATVNGSAYN